jgi:hypothetical protein
MAAIAVRSELHTQIDRQLEEIRRQLSDPKGYPFDPRSLQELLQLALDGQFDALDELPRKILDPIGTAVIAPTPENFIANERFVLASGPEATIQVTAIGGNFRSWFLSKPERPEPTLGETRVRSNRLRKTTIDSLILNELGGEDKVETTLPQMYAMMLAQRNGEPGPLLNDGWYNIFYVRDVNGVLQAVINHWYVPQGGWRLGADRIDGPCRWCAGDRIFTPAV